MNAKEIIEAVIDGGSVKTIINEILFPNTSKEILSALDDPRSSVKFGIYKFNNLQKAKNFSERSNNLWIVSKSNLGPFYVLKPLMAGKLENEGFKIIK